MRGSYSSQILVIFDTGADLGQPWITSVFVEKDVNHKEKQRGCPLLDGNKHIHIYIYIYGH